MDKQESTKLGRPEGKQERFHRLPNGDHEISTVVFYRILMLPQNAGARTRAKIQRKNTPEGEPLVPRRALRLSDTLAEAREIKARAQADLLKYEQIVETIQQVQAMLADGAAMGDIAASLKE